VVGGGTAATSSLSAFLVAFLVPAGGLPHEPGRHGGVFGGSIIGGSVVDSGDIDVGGGGGGSGGVVNALFVVGDFLFSKIGGGGWGGATRKWMQIGEKISI